MHLIIFVNDLITFSKLDININYKPIYLEVVNC